MRSVTFNRITGIFHVLSFSLLLIFFLSLFKIVHIIDLNSITYGIFNVFIVAVPFNVLFHCVSVSEDFNKRIVQVNKLFCVVAFVGSIIAFISLCTNMGGSDIVGILSTLIVFIVVSLLNLWVQHMGDLVYELRMVICTCSPAYKCLCDIHDKIIKDNELALSVVSKIKRMNPHIRIDVKNSRGLANFNSSSYFIDIVSQVVSKNDWTYVVKMKEQYDKLKEENKDVLNHRISDSDLTVAFVDDRYRNIDMLQAEERDFLSQGYENINRDLFLDFDIKLSVTAYYYTPKRHDLRSETYWESLSYHNMSSYVRGSGYSVGSYSSQRNDYFSNSQSDYHSRIRNFDRDAKRVADYAQRQRILRRDNFTCQLCGNVGKGYRDEQGRTPEQLGLKIYPLEIDHKIPFSKGGQTTDDNLWTLCRPCNQGKSNRYDDSKM